MALFLKSRQMWDMPMAGNSADKHITHWCGNIIWGFLAFLFKICFRYRVDGRENLRAFDNRQGAVVIANHTSFLDVVFLYLSARPSQWIRLMGRDSLFEAAHGLGGQVLSRVGAFPVKRDSADMTAVKRAAKMLKNGELVGILPEGTRRGKGTKVPSLHAGAAMVARMGKAPIIPATVRNAENIKRKGEHLRFPKVTIEYGTPVSVSSFDFLPKEDRLEGCTWYMMREVFALSLGVAATDVDMKSLFPETKDYSEAFADVSIPAFVMPESSAE